MNTKYVSITIQAAKYEICNVELIMFYIAIFWNTFIFPSQQNQLIYNSISLALLIRAIEQVALTVIYQLFVINRHSFMFFKSFSGQARSTNAILLYTFTTTLYIVAIIIPCQFCTTPYDGPWPMLHRAISQLGAD